MLEKKIIIVVILLVLIGTIVPMGFVNAEIGGVGVGVNSLKRGAASGPGMTSGTYYNSAAGDLALGTPKSLYDDISAGLRWIWEQIKKVWQENLKQSATIAYKNSLRYFLNKVAYDTATYIATGSPGKKPLFITEDWPTYFQKVGDEAVGSFLYEVGNKWWGKNICVPWQPLAQIDLTVAVKRAAEPQKPVCTWVDIRKNFTRLNDLQLKDLVQFRTNFNPGANQLGAYLTMRSGTLEYKAQKEKEDNLVRIIEGQFKSVVNPITKQVKTPSNLVAESMKVAYQKTFTPMETYTGSPVADAIGTFTNTLVSKWLEKVFTKGFNPASGKAVVSDVWTMGGAAAAQLFFADLAQVNYQFDVGIGLEELTAEGPAQFSNLIGDDFARAIEQKCTVGQATGFYKPGDDAYRPECLKSAPDNGLISKTAILGYTMDKNTEPSAIEGIPMRTILALRKFRVVPVGWELAAAYYNQYGREESKKPLTLDTVMQNFNKNKSPYYQLVDPDWVLKFPLTKCVREGAGPEIIEVIDSCSILLENGEECPEKNKIYSLQRVDYCADYKNCLDDTSGQCAMNNWGYCLEEKPVWNIKSPGTVCPNKYEATCETLTDNKTEKNASYLLNTVSGKEVCESDSALGCRAYCSLIEAPFTKENWICEAGNFDNVIYLNDKSKDCKASAEGCTLVYTSKNKNENELSQALGEADAYAALNKKFVKLPPAGDMYGCLGYSQLLPDITSLADCEDQNHYWRSDIKMCVESGADICANFAKVCQVDDVNCQLYTPVSFEGPAVPGVAEKRECSDGTNQCSDDQVSLWQDECPAECVGYKKYHQEATQFEQTETELEKQFIASTATTCSEPGCDEFTNLDEVAKGGEGIEYYSYLRQCVKPDENDAQQKTYYTWEGSDTSGYQLKKWELLSVENGNTPVGTSCINLNEKDCREYFDKDLKAYKIKYSTTIIITEDCHPYRKSMSIKTDCEKTHGNWLNGQCIYNAVPSENISCSANNNMCRSYKSNQSYNYQKLINSTFALGDLDNWTGGKISRESVRRGDYSLKVDGMAQHSLVLGDLEIGKSYTVEFLAKSPSSAYVSVSFENERGEQTSENIKLSTDWQFYSLNLPNDNKGLTLSEVDTLTNTLVINGSGYFDNIVLKKIDNLMVIKDSWVTPNSCDLTEATSNGTEATMLGCEKYEDSNQEEINLRSWARLCFEEAVGCEPIINTHNYKNNLSQHEIGYYVLNKKFECAAGKNNEANMGCARLGLITPDIYDETEQTYSDVYKIVLPEEDAIENALAYCVADEVFCNSYTYYTTDGNSNVYKFKDPAGRVCTWNGGKKSWLAPDGSLCPNEDESLYYESHCLGGVKFDPATGEKFNNETCASNDECTNLALPGQTGTCSTWVAGCNEDSSGCREYQDPQEPKGCNKICANNSPLCLDEDGNKKLICNYYYFKEAESCQQGVNPYQGCVGFNQTDLDQTNLDKRSYKVCPDDKYKPCQNDGDCTAGRCVYSNEGIEQ